MALALATTTITVRRVAADPARDPYDAEPEPVTVASGVAAHIFSPTGEEQTAGGSRSNVNIRLAADPVDLNAETDTVVDDTTGVEYAVEWARDVVGLGLDHTQARLRHTTGVV